MECKETFLRTAGRFFQSFGEQKESFSRSTAILSDTLIVVWGYESLYNGIYAKLTRLQKQTDLACKRERGPDRQSCALESRF